MPANERKEDWKRQASALNGTVILGHGTRASRKDPDMQPAETLESVLKMLDDRFRQRMKGRGGSREERLRGLFGGG